MLNVGILCEYCKAARLHEILMLGISVIGKGVNADSSARHEHTANLNIFRIHQRLQILHDDINAILMKITVITEGEEIELKTLALHHIDARDIGDVDMTEIRLTGLRTKRSEFRAIKCDNIEYNKMGQ